MTADDPESAVALLVVRAWRDGPGAAGVRARIWSSRRLPDEPVRIRMLASAEELEEAVTGWLEQLSNG